MMLRALLEFQIKYMGFYTKVLNQVKKYNVTFLDTHAVMRKYFNILKLNN
jgi:hypothetical protein